MLAEMELELQSEPQDKLIYLQSNPIDKEEEKIIFSEHNKLSSVGN